MQKVPLMLWSNLQLAREFSELNSLVNDVYPQDLLNGYSYEDKITRVAFVQKNIDIEQFSRANLPFISKLFDETDAVFFPYSEYVPEFYSKFDAYIPLNKETLEQNEPIIKSYVEQFNQSGPVIFILTGQENFLYESLADTSQKLRLPRKTEGRENKDVLQYPSKDPCVYIFISEIEFQYYDKESKKYHFEDISVSDGTCYNVTEKNKKNAASIQLNMSSNNSSNSFNVKIKFEFQSMWKISSVEVWETGSENKWSNKNLTTYTEDGFSYSCSKKIFKLGLNNSISEASYAKITFNRFQVQPFVFEKSPFKFEESFDCAVWFTLPIFSSLFVCLLLVFILYCGIRALLSISTPDRFENPKSKGLILTGVE